MDWYRLFRQHILDRGMQYHVEITLDEEDVLDMYCSCPHAAGGYNCKHMAAVLFQFEEMLAEQDAEREYDIDSDVVISDDEVECDIPTQDFFERFNKQKAEVVELVSKIPEDKVRELLVGFVLADEGLKNKLQMQYAFKMNSKLVYKDVTIDSKSYASWASTSFACQYSGYYPAVATIIGTTNSSYAVQFIVAPACSGYWKLINTYSSALTVGFTIRCYFVKQE